jgi:hypothetical protein
MKLTLTTLLAFFIIAVSAQTTKTEVMTLGVFHFNFPNLDVVKTNENDKIDVFEPKHQKEIENIVAKVAKFKPTIIVIERQPQRQQYTDSIYAQYLSGNYQLKRNEEEQIGFRLAKQFGIKKLYCVDEWGNFNERVNNIVYGKDSVEAKKFEAYFENNPDASKRIVYDPIFKTKGILAALRQANDETLVKESLGNYLIGPFKYESKEHDFTGVDFETGRWFSRNLKIFRNVQRIETRTTDRVLVIYGAGHLNLLNYFFDCSPEYKRVKTNDFLK